MHIKNVIMQIISKKNDPEIFTAFKGLSRYSDTKSYFVYITSNVFTWK